MPLTDNYIFELDENVTRKPVSYKNRFGITISADLYLPKDFDESREHAAIVVGAPYGGVKEHPDIFVEDFSTAVDFLGTRPFVSRERIGALGMCGSGGFALSAAQVDRRIKAVATVSMYDISRAQSCGFGDSFTDEDRNQILDAIGEQRYAEFEGGAPVLTPRGASIGFDETPDPIGREFGEFYSTPRGYHPSSITQFTLTSSMSFMTSRCSRTSSRSRRGPYCSSSETTRTRGTSARTPTRLRPSQGALHRPERRPRRPVRQDGPDSVRQARRVLQREPGVPVERRRRGARRLQVVTSERAARMTRVFITGSADGLGRAAAQTLIEDGHEVVVHVRSTDRLAAVRNLLDSGTEAVVGDLSDLEETRDVAAQVNRLGPVNAVIHNAGVIRGPHVLPVNVVAPYLLTALIDRPQRLIYLSSSMHRGGRARLTGMDWSGHRTTGSYSDSKLFVTTLAIAIARIWPDVLSNAVDPGWVPTRMGGAGAPDDLRLGHLTQEWLATSEDSEARTSGGYWHHQGRAEPAPAVHDAQFQDDLLGELARFTATPLTDTNSRRPSCVGR